MPIEYSEQGSKMVHLLYPSCKSIFIRLLKVGRRNKYIHLYEKQRQKEQKKSCTKTRLPRVIHNNITTGSTFE